jgi:hypothetical protein
MSDKPAFLSEQYAEQAIKRWDHLLDGIKGDYKRAAMATLLDNQKEYLENTGYTTSADVQVFTTLAFPLIRRIYTGIYADRLVSIQPMRQPTGKIFFLDFLYGSNLDPIRRHQRMDYQVNQGLTINQARFYTKGRARGQVLGTGDAAQTAFEVDHNLTPWLETQFTPLRQNANLKIYVDGVERVLVFGVAPAGQQVRAYPEVGRFEFAAAPANGAVITADFDVRLEGDDSRIPEMTLAMSSDAIAAETRKLKYRWTIESEQDLRAYHGLSVESELATHAAAEIAREIDREIIFDLLDAATVNVNWQRLYDPAAGQPGEGYSRKEYEDTIVHAILDADKRIYDRRLVRANWLVTGTDVALRLEKLDTFRQSGTFSDPSVSIQGTPNVLGTLNNRFEVIVDPIFPQNTILLGHKGATFMETGYVYAPYQPLMITDRMMDPNDFTPRRGMMRRDATKLVSGDFYARVTLV